MGDPLTKHKPRNVKLVTLLNTCAKKSPQEGGGNYKGGETSSALLGAGSGSWSLGCP